MSQWEARLETIIRSDIARSAHQRSEISASGSQPIVKKDRAIHAGGGSPPTHPDAFHLQTAECTVARMRAVHRSVEVAGEAHEAGDAVIIVLAGEVLAGEVDLAASNPVRDALTRALREPRPGLIVDLRAVTFIDASGLHVILDAYKLCRDAGRTLTIRPGPPNVQRVFELTNLVDYLPFEAGE